MSAIYKSISATNQIKVGFTVLKGIFISSASSTPTITVYDSGTADTNDPTILAVFTPAAATNHTFTANGITASKGLYVVISGTVAATLFFE
jgi:hypothetical protein|tara:strand:+ start:52 stop:324 length:273 start_codon:yes stop_codon:yes gene_type:complete